MRKPLSYLVTLGIGAVLGVGTVSYAAPTTRAAPSLETRVAMLERQINRPLRLGLGSIDDARHVVRNWCVWLRHSNATRPREIGDPVAALLANWKLSCGAFRN